ncbi:ABC transporter ATP-binding protein [Intrasporangium mesophilum]
MTQAGTHRSLRPQLEAYLELAGVTSRRWLVSVVVGSVALALLDTLGVAAMLPLMQLFTTNGGEQGAAVTAVGNVIGSHDPQTLIPVVAGLIVVAFVGKSVATIGFRWWLLGRTTRVSADASSALLRRYVLSPFAAHRMRNLPEIYRVINEATLQSSGVLLGVVGMMSDLLLLAAIVVVLAVASPGVMLLAGAMFGVVVWVTQRAMRPFHARIGDTVAETGLQAWSLLIPALNGFREARLTSTAGALAHRFRVVRQRQARAQRQLLILSELPRYLLEICFVAAIGVLGFVLFSHNTPAEALGILAVFGAASLRALPTLNRVTATLAIIRANRIGLDLVLDARDDLDASPLHVEIPVSPTRFAGDIEVRDVAFRFRDADTDTLHGLTTTIRQNTTVAFVGSSGAGKSTLIDLVLGLLEPTHGSIRCGGRSIGDDLAGWYAGLGVVPQDVFLTNDTVAANIAYGVSEADVDRERIARVVSMAQLDQLLADLPEGLDTPVGERGIRLSGGQRQRLGLARALYRQPSVLVLDEATSALDNLTEHKISRTLRDLHGSMTIVIVAHRLSTVRDADRIVFMNEGRIAAEGTFAEVRRTDVDFARLVELGELA